MTAKEMKRPVPFSRRRGFFAGASETSWHAILLQKPVSRKHLDMDLIEREMLAGKFVVSCAKDVGSDLLDGRLATPPHPWVLLAQLGSHRWLYVLSDAYSKSAALALASAGGYRVIGAERQAPAGVVELTGYQGRGSFLHYRVAPNERSYPAGYHGSRTGASGHASYKGAGLPQSWWKKSASGLSMAASHIAEYSAYAAGIAVRDDSGTIRMSMLPGESIDGRSFARIDLLCLRSRLVP